MVADRSEITITLLNQWCRWGVERHLVMAQPPTAATRSVTMLVAADPI